MNFFIGLWPIVSHFGGWMILIGVCVAVALLTTELAAIPLIGPFLATLAKPIRMWAIVAAASATVGLIGYSMGVKHESDRCKAQFAAAQKAAIDRSSAAHSNAVRDDARGVCDKRDLDCK